MSDVAALIADMVRAGVDPELIGRTAATIAGAAQNIPAPKTARQERNARYYQKKASEKRLNSDDQDVSDVGANLLSPEGSSPIPPSPKPLSSNPPSPPKGGSSPADFDRFWAMFPNKVGKRDAEKAFAKATQRASLEAILGGLIRYAAKTDDRPWCNPATFLNQNRWEDQPAPAPQRQATAPPKKTTHASMWTDEAIAFGIIDEPGSTQDRRLDARLPRGQDQGSNFSRRIASA